MQIIICSSSAYLVFLPPQSVVTTDPAIFNNRTLDLLLRITGEGCQSSANESLKFAGLPPIDPRHENLGFYLSI